MGEPRFTPGPWDIKPYVDAIDIVAPNGSLIAHIADRDISSTGMPPDNARLIHAAPDLYAACKLLAKWDDDVEKLNVIESVVRQEQAVDAACIALAKVHGRSK